MPWGGGAPLQRPGRLCPVPRGLCEGLRGPHSRADSPGGAPLGQRGEPGLAGGLEPLPVAGTLSPGTAVVSVGCRLPGRGSAVKPQWGVGIPPHPPETQEVGQDAAAARAPPEPRLTRGCASKGLLGSPLWERPLPPRNSVGSSKTHTPGDFLGTRRPSVCPGLAQGSAPPAPGCDPAVGVGGAHMGTQEMTSEQWKPGRGTRTSREKRGENLQGCSPPRQMAGPHSPRPARPLGPAPHPRQPRRAAGTRRPQPGPPPHRPEGLRTQSTASWGRGGGLTSQPRRPPQGCPSPWSLLPSPRSRPLVFQHQGRDAASAQPAAGPGVSACIKGSLAGSPAPEKARRPRYPTALSEEAGSPRPSSAPLGAPIQQRTCFRTGQGHRQGQPGPHGKAFCAGRPPTRREHPAGCRDAAEALPPVVVRSAWGRGTSRSVPSPSGPTRKGHHSSACRFSCHVSPPHSRRWKRKSGPGPPVRAGRGPWGREDCAAGGCRRPREQLFTPRPSLVPGTGGGRGGGGASPGEGRCSPPPSHQWRGKRRIRSAGLRGWSAWGRRDQPAVRPSPGEPAQRPPRGRAGFGRRFSGRVVGPSPSLTLRRSCRRRSREAAAPPWPEVPTRVAPPPALLPRSACSQSHKIRKMAKCEVPPSPCRPLAKASS